LILIFFSRLEFHLRNFTALTLNSHIEFEYNKKFIDLEVVELKPGPAICLLNADVQVDFVETERPNRIKTPPPQPKRAISVSPKPSDDKVKVSTLNGKLISVSAKEKEQFLNEEKKQQATVSTPDVPYFSYSYTSSGKPVNSEQVKKFKEHLKTGNEADSAEPKEKKSEVVSDPVPHVLNPKKKNIDIEKAKQFLGSVKKENKTDDVEPPIEIREGGHRLMDAPAIQENPK
jgi:hypothetical protein